MVNSGPFVVTSELSPCAGGGGCRGRRCGSHHQRHLRQPVESGQCLLFLWDNHHDHRWVSGVRSPSLYRLGSVHTLRLSPLTRHIRLWEHLSKDGRRPALLHLLRPGGNPIVWHPSGWSRRPPGDWVKENGCQNRESLPG